MGLFDPLFTGTSVFPVNMTSGQAEQVRSLLEGIGSMVGKATTLTLDVNDDIAAILQEGIGRLIERYDSNTGELILRLDRLSDGIAAMGADFHWFLVKAIWQMELHGKTLQSLLDAVQHPLEIRAKELRERAVWSYQRSLIEKAKADLLEADSIDYRDFSVHRTLAHIYLNDTQPPNQVEAVKYFKKSARFAKCVAPKDAAEALFQAAQISSDLGRTEEGINDCIDSLKIDQNLLESYFLLAVLLVRVKDARTEKAPWCLEQAVQQDAGYFQRIKQNQELQSCQIIQDLLARLEADLARTRDDLVKKLSWWQQSTYLPQELVKISERLLFELAQPRPYRASAATASRVHSFLATLDALLHQFRVRFEMTAVLQGDIGWWNGVDDNGDNFVKVKVINRRMGNEMLLVQPLTEPPTSQEEWIPRHKFQRGILPGSSALDAIFRFGTILPGDVGDWNRADKNSAYVKVKVIDWRMEMTMLLIQPVSEPPAFQKEWIPRDEFQPENQRWPQAEEISSFLAKHRHCHPDTELARKI